MPPKATTVSITLPVYNEERFLPATLDSLLGQTFEDFELIVSDNASTDRTGQIVQEYARKDARILYFRNEENIGALNNFNRLLKHARGEFVWIVAGHDLWDKNFLEACLARFCELPQALLVYAKGYWLEEDGTPGASLGPALDLVSSDPWTRFFQAVKGLECYSIYGVFRRESLRQGCMVPCVLLPDHPVLAELALRGKIGYVPNTTFYMRLLVHSLGLQKSIQRIFSSDQRLGRRRVVDFCLDVFRHYYALIRKYEPSCWRRAFQYVLVTGLLWRRWYRLLIQTVMLTWCPEVLQSIRKMFRKYHLTSTGETTE